ncbi:Oidioi.mRNA.OKI2018_I69.chr2.g4730.t1.cds [Oikopleura dioica]|uniref:Oidioi.mRNA.OKI2018_I69.chr2.g4730.t1.cds n=1 Tax=Oikopleura dioica TaxID=34765 RepID=A0ABN7T4U1_OIKDI|nr:Oidioi.mRNA.OKI2018_I69.chr2.g4730.t1.cds [Oikopleura dioica]
MVDPENQESSDAGEPQVPWLVKWGAKGLSLAGAVGVGISAIWCFLSLANFIPCIIGGVSQVVSAILIFVIEVTFLFKNSQSKPLKAALWIASKMRWWLRALLYVGLAIFFVAMCFGIGNLVSMFMLGGGGVLYGIGSFQHKRNTGGALF